jgi:hypothetical protein
MYGSKREKGGTADFLSPLRNRLVPFHGAMETTIHRRGVFIDNA